MSQKSLMTKLLADELISSMGCTEPSAIAYSVAYAKEHLTNNEAIKEIEFYGSSNILKNALCVHIPNTNLCGIKIIILLALTKCKSEDKLNILSNIDEEDIKKTQELEKQIKLKVNLKENDNSLYIETIIKTDNHKVKVKIIQKHNFIQLCEVDGQTIEENEIIETSPKLLVNLNFNDIYDYVIKREYDKRIIEQTKKYNYEISQYGLNNDVGLNVGSTLADSSIYNSEYSKIISTTVAGIDSRMSGVSKKVIINNGSGNQGITATVPIAEYAKINNIPEDIEYDALTLSHLVALYIRKNQGKLSSSCGAVCASAGTTAGIAYMMGCNKEQIEGAINNLLCSTFGVLCDGAKATCSLKVATAISAAINSAVLAKNNVFLNENLGIVSSSLDTTVKSIGTVEKQLTKKLDKVIMDEAMNLRGCE